MVSCVGIGTITGAIFLTVLLFVAGDIDNVINSSAGPVLRILIHSTQNRAGGICLLMYVFSEAILQKMAELIDSDCLSFAWYWPR